MKEPEFGAKVLVVVGLVFSVAGFAALLALAGKPPHSEPVERIGYICALFSCAWLATICSSACFAYLARRWGWPANSFASVVVPFAVAGFIFVVAAALLNLSTALYAGGAMQASAACFALTTRRFFASS
jgi:hypothetical protein